MLGVKSISGLAFYDWESLDLIRRIEIQPKHVRNASFNFPFVKILYISLQMYFSLNVKVSKLTFLTDLYCN